MTAHKQPDDLLYGASPDEGLVALELVASDAGDDMELFVRSGDSLERKREPFRPFLLMADDKLARQAAPGAAVTPLHGPGVLTVLVDFDSWAECQRVKTRLGRLTGRSAGAADAPYWFVNDPIQQHLMRTGRTLFKGLRFDQLRRLVFDLECRTTPGFEFCHPEREGDRIIAIAMADNRGWKQVLSGAEMDERDLIEAFVKIVRDHDPDVIEGHNLFQFDLPYLAARARRHGVPLAIGRDGSAPATRPSRFTAGERVVSYTRFDVFGRHVVDTLFLLQSYDAAHRSLEGFGLKEAAMHFGLAVADREYVEGAEITRVFERDPRRLMRYALHDAVETEALARLLSLSAFAQAAMVPFSYQNICLRGNAAKIDAMMLRAYLARGAALPLPDKPRPFAGGYTDLFVRGVVRNVHRCDVRSLYPSLMLAHRIAPRNDSQGVFLALLEKLRSFRIEAKEKTRRAGDQAERLHWDALQTAFKVLINSFYGYLGFEQARFSDFDAAERVTAEGRRLLKWMTEWLRDHGAQPVELDTDGIYFVPPPGGEQEQEAFRSSFQKALPNGIEIEFDEAYPVMFSYRMKNYALRTAGGEIILKGAALRSRGLEPYLRAFLRDFIRLKLEGQDKELPRLREEYARAIRDGMWPIERLARTESLQDTPSAYAVKVDRRRRGRSAAYELALRSGREYKAGDQVSYYVTGEKKNVSVHQNAKLTTDFDPAHRDENKAYYLAKLDALFERLCASEGDEDPETEEPELDLQTEGGAE